MITTHVESLQEHIEEIKPFLPVHYEELALDKARVPLNPNFEEYFRLEQLGILFFAVLREKGRMIGYYIGFIEPNLHYQDTLECKTDIFYLEQSQRGRGYAVQFFKDIEAALKKRGVRRWFVGSKSHKDASRFFERMDFRKIETYHSKLIG